VESQQAQYAFNDFICHWREVISISALRIADKEDMKSGTG
jgi:hypothetical protein